MEKTTKTHYPRVAGKALCGSQSVRDARGVGMAQREFLGASKAERCERCEENLRRSGAAVDDWIEAHGGEL